MSVFYCVASGISMFLGGFLLSKLLFLCNISLWLLQNLTRRVDVHRHFSLWFCKASSSFLKKTVLYVLFLVCVFLNVAWNHVNKVVNREIACAHGALCLQIPYFII